MEMLVIIGIALVLMVYVVKSMSTTHVSDIYQPPPATAPLHPDARYQRLSQHVQAAVVRGARVQSQDGRSAVVVYGKPVNHVLHAILSIFMLGLWLFVWVPMAIFGGERRELLSVDDYGHISTQRL